MRTRRSPRNQDIIWRALGNVQRVTPRKRSKLPSKAEVRAAMFGTPTLCHDCPFLAGTAPFRALNGQQARFVAENSDTPFHCHTDETSLCQGFINHQRKDVP